MAYRRQDAGLSVWHHSYPGPAGNPIASSSRAGFHRCRRCGHRAEDGHEHDDHGGSGHVAARAEKTVESAQCQPACAAGNRAESDQSAIEIGPVRAPEAMGIGDSAGLAADADETSRCTGVGPAVGATGRGRWQAQRRFGAGAGTAGHL